MNKILFLFVICTIIFASCNNEPITLTGEWIEYNSEDPHNLGRTALIHVKLNKNNSAYLWVETFLDSPKLGLESFMWKEEPIGKIISSKDGNNWKQFGTFENGILTMDGIPFMKKGRNYLFNLKDATILVYAIIVIGLILLLIITRLFLIWLLGISKINDRIDSLESKIKNLKFYVNNNLPSVK